METLPACKCGSAFSVSLCAAALRLHKIPHSDEKIARKAILNIPGFRALGINDDQYKQADLIVLDRDCLKSRANEI